MSKSIFPVVMPKLGMEMTEGQIAQWHFAEGDLLTPGEDLAEIETDKLSMAYEVEFAGRLKNIIAEEGVIYPVGQLLAVIAAEGVSDEDITAFVASYQARDPDAASGAADLPPDAASNAADFSPDAASNAADSSPEAAQDTEAEHNRAAAQTAADESLDVSPVAARLAAENQVSIAGLVGTGRLGRVSLADVERATGQTLGRKSNQHNASPAARRCARRRGIELSQVAGSGPKGRILKGDVEAAVGATPQAKSLGPAGYRSEPVSPMRKVIARRLVQSKAEAPHHYLRIELHMAPLMALRKGMNHRLAEGKVSVNDLLIKAVGLALRDVPEANVQYTDDQMRYFDQADVGVAVAIEGGLITPVVRGACTKSVVDISREVASLADKARQGGLQLADIEGGTITVTNLGMYGIQSFDAVVNPPQGAIVAVGAVENRPANVDGEVALAPMMHVTLSCDHRAIDGAVGARYLAALKELIENPVSLIM